MGVPTQIAHSGAQTFTPLGSAALKHIAPADRRHAQTEPVGPLSFDAGRLISPFHSTLLKKGYSVKRAPALSEWDKQKESVPRVAK